VSIVQYYSKSVADPAHIVVGGIGATLLPDYIRSRAPCKVIEGPLDVRGKLCPGSPPLAQYIPDYGIIDASPWKYQPANAYFCRVTLGCVRSCRFCAVPRLEPRFTKLHDWRSQITDARHTFGERKDLVVLDNNILATDGFLRVLDTIRDEGFVPGAKLNNRQRAVDFNQGIDARFITKDTASALSRICLSPVRLAFDFDAVEPAYRRAIRHLADGGFKEFTNYVLFNFKDGPASLYRRLRVNLELSTALNIRITGFPMRYIPIEDVKRGYIAPLWRWRYLRGIQCVLLATHGVVSPNPVFFDAAFGESEERFLEILSMPDRYIIHRERYKEDGAQDWVKLYRKLSPGSREEFLMVLERVHRAPDRVSEVAKHRRFRTLLAHYYPCDNREAGGARGERRAGG
jgi:hypothetical protein